MNIKELAEQAEIEGVAGPIRALERFARLAYAAGAAAEREECANTAMKYEPIERHPGVTYASDAIRARGKT